MPYILVFDVGTTAVKASLFGEDLRLAGHTREEYTLLTEADRAELSPETYWQAVKRTLAALLTETKISPSAIRAVTVTTQGETIIPIDRAGRPLCNAIVWVDQRAEAEAEEIAKKISRRDFYRATGIPECTGMYPLTKIMWLRKHRPEVYENTDKFLLLEDYILFRLTGALVTEKSLLCTSGYFNIQTDEYDGALLSLAGIDPALLPIPLECGAVVGAVTAEAAAELGLSEKTQVITGAMDQMTAALGAGNLTPGVVTETTGSGMTITASTKNPSFENEEFLPIYRHVEKGSYLLAPVCITAGQVLKWFKDEFCREEAALAQKRGISVYALLDELVEGVDPAANRMVMLPYFSGVMQPDSNPRARGVFFGVGLESKREQFLQSIFEGVAFQLRENIELIQRVSGAPVTDLRALGGGANSRVWLQIKADVLGIPLSAMEEGECTSLGAAILAARALGYCAGPEEGAALGNRPARRVLPNGSKKALYDRKYETYRALYGRLRDLF